MTAGLKALKQRLAEDRRALAFAKGFSESYFGQAFGVLPKSEIDLLVFGLLIDTGVLSADQPLYDIARSLNVTPAKARSLLFQHQLRTMDDDALNASVLIAVRHGKYAVDGKRLSLGVESPIVRSAIAAKSKSRGVFADISLSGEILQIPMSQFGDFLAGFMSADQAENLTRRLRAKGVLDAAGLAATLNKVGGKIAEKAAVESVKQVSERIGDFFEWAQDAAAAAGDDIPAAILDYLG